MKYIIRKGIQYFQSFHDAKSIRDRLGGEARVVKYTLGWAVQYYPSGPYFPDAEATARAHYRGKGKLCND